MDNSGAPRSRRSSRCHQWFWDHCSMNEDMNVSAEGQQCDAKASQYNLKLEAL